MDFDQFELRQSRDVRDVVRDRRYADKVAPLVRWAPGSTNGVRPEDRISTLATSLLKNPIGTHAMSHLEVYAELNPNRPRYHWSLARTQREAESEKDHLRSALHFLLESGLHRAFDRMLVVDGEGARACRPLEGSHGVEAFVDELFVGRVARHPRQRNIALDVVRAALGRLGLSHRLAVKT